MKSVAAIVSVSQMRSSLYPCFTLPKVVKGSLFAGAQPRKTSFRRLHHEGMVDDEAV
jgi:hypothetical protein